MNTVTIAGDTRSLQDADASWIHQLIEGRRKDGKLTCVRVSLDLTDAHLALETPTCSGGHGGGRAPNPKEAEIFRLWQQCGLGEQGFRGANLVQFLARLHRYM